ncbi:expressed unknown protein [Seminavis robusta]|uniref:Uncharacterized protein n=1 Tax=Seminavis robusta TaxID=568900 RepID=A0A9N8DU24_9STRA|nr:expressed unknown protein [Seminavis robusta]|eukprot:Sro279_g106750.1 n/a (204) ;mRNA; f:25957-26568
MKIALFSFIFWGTSVSAFVTPPTSPTRPVILQVASMEDVVTLGNPTTKNPRAVVADLLEALLKDDDAHQCIQLLLHSSTHQWRSKIYDAIGAPAGANENTVAGALAHAMHNHNSQFAILLGQADESYVADFPSDTVETGGDGRCWLECRLYDRNDGELLVVSGWDLQQDSVSGDWLVDRIDWQDFRDAFYPGIGREEWARAFV